MDRPGLQVPGHTIHRLLRTSSGGSVGFAFVLDHQVAGDWDSFGGLQLERLDPLVLEGDEGKTGPAVRAEGGRRSQKDSSSSNLFQDTASSSSIQVLSMESHQNIKDKASELKIITEATLNDIKLVKISTNTTVYAGAKAMVKTMAEEMLKSLNKSVKRQRYPNPFKRRGREFPNNVFKEYYVDSPEISFKWPNSNDTPSKNIYVTCKLCDRRLSKNKFCTHMRKMHLPDEICSSCGKEFPASKILGHRRKCGSDTYRMKGEDISPRKLGHQVQELQQKKQEMEGQKVQMEVWKHKL